MIPQFDPKQRVTPEYVDALHIYKARIVRDMGPEDDRLEVRIIPHMVGLPATDPLPKYPSFFQGQVIHGRSERDDKNNADYVWVAALPDFTVGFILGLANSYEGPSKFSNSYNYKDVIQKLTEKGLIPEYVDYKDLLVQYWHGNYLEMVNVRYGDKYIIQSNGNMIVMEKNQIYLRVGSGNTEKDGGTRNLFSAIRITRNELSIVSPKISLKGDVKFGEGGLTVATITGAPITVQGATINPIPNVTV